MTKHFENKLDEEMCQLVYKYLPTYTIEDEQQYISVMTRTTLHNDQVCF